MSAIPSTVTGSGASQSSILTPRARRSAIAARMSGTRQASCVCVSRVPIALVVTATCAHDPLPKSIRSSGSSRRSGVGPTLAGQPPPDQPGRSAAPKICASSNAGVSSSWS